MTTSKTYPPVLIAAPVAAELKEYCIWEWVAYVKNLSYPNYQVLLIDNSESDEIQHRLREKGIAVVRQPPNGRYFRDLLADAWNIIRRVALRKGFAYHLALETDVFGPYNIIERLLADSLTYRLAAVGFSYFLGNGENSDLMAFNWHKTLKGWDAIQSRRLGGYKLMDGKLKQTFNVGQGCLLVNTRAYKNVRFRYTADASPDTHFANDLWKKKMPVYMDTSVLMRHKNKDYDRTNDTSRSI